MNETSRKTFHSRVRFFFLSSSCSKVCQCFRLSSCPTSNKFVVSLTWAFFTFDLRISVTVEEITPLGKVIFQVRATDADYGNHSIITYSLVPSHWVTPVIVQRNSLLMLHRGISLLLETWIRCSTANRAFKMRRRRKRYFKTVFANPHSLSPIWQFAYLFKCKRTLLELNY